MPAVSATRQPRPPAAPAAQRRARAAAVVAAGGAEAARGAAAAVDARPAELLVRRGVHARARPAPEPVGDAALGRPHREHAAAVVRARVGRLARARHRRDRAAPALGARRDRDRAGRLGDRPRARRAPRGDRVRGARRGQPAVRVVLAGGARVRAVRAHGGAGDAVLPARRARADARGAWPRSR